LRVEHPWRDAHAAARAVHGVADAGRRCAGRPACGDFLLAGSGGSGGGGAHRAAPASALGPLTLPAHMYKIKALRRRDNFVLDVAIEQSGPGVLALFGRSGCGKTTLVNIIAGLLAADEAYIEIDGVVLEDSAAKRRTPAERRRIGYVFQDARLFPHFDVVGNLRYGERRVRDGARRISLD